MSEIQKQRVKITTHTRDQSPSEADPRITAVRTRGNQRVDSVPAGGVSVIYSDSITAEISANSSVIIRVKYPQKVPNGFISYTISSDKADQILGHNMISRDDYGFALLIENLHEPCAVSVSWQLTA